MTLDGLDLYRPITVEFPSNGIWLVVQALTLANGRTPVGELHGGGALIAGGGMMVAGGLGSESLIRDTTITDNTAGSGFLVGEGGGLRLSPGAGDPLTVSLENSVVAANFDLAGSAQPDVFCGTNFGGFVTRLRPRAPAPGDASRASRRASRRGRPRTSVARTSTSIAATSRLTLSPPAGALPGHRPVPPAPAVRARSKAVSSARRTSTRTSCRR